jgi:hypothetical protein
VHLSDDKQTVTLTLSDFKPFSRLSWPSKILSYRLSLVIAQLPDFSWSENDKQYNPVAKDMDLLTVSSFTPWRPNDTESIDITLQASFAAPALQIPGTTVIVAVGIEVSSLATAFNGTEPSIFGSMKIVQCFV